ncbi:DMT family transporter [Mesorhizobium sp. RMAD-H1]|uniref:DMT family transporter n=1 Tax=Mesorhizobium sp. RMAD-H1 TaxID=2587065 RepID=UPI00160B78B6|nr:DMT family transporter [Mesorhizobium sp. RMAD-H1]MBB2972059.1 drug/metabolite transporter (DMT)-like permease [Mesorhizobium sp. RMAD-H1]
MKAQPSILKAALWMTGWLSLMLVTAIAGRETTRELDVFQVMLVRSVIGFFMLYPLVHASGGLAAMKTARPLGHIGRNVVHYTGQYLWLYALTLIPLAQLIAIEFTMPIWTAILAVVFLGERMNIWKNTAIVLGLIGVAIIVRPGGGINPGQLYALASAVGFAISVVMVKSLTRTESVVKIIFWMLIIQSLIGLIPAIPVWRWPSLEVWPWLFVIAFGGTFSHYCMARAMLHADATVVVPMDFLRVPLTALAGWLIYSERVDTITVLGATLILAGNMLNLKSAGTARIRPALDTESSGPTSN